MPYLIKASDDNTIQINSSIERIVEKLSSELNQNYRLMICDNVSWIEYYADNTGLVEKWLNEGLGISIPNIISNNNRYHMAIINCLNCLFIKLNNEEFDTIIAHELGHLLNVPTYPQLPIVISPETHLQRSTLLKEYNEQKEFYADYFALTVTSKETVLSAIEKLMNSPLAKNIELFEKRISYLRNNVVFSGTPVSHLQ